MGSRLLKNPGKLPYAFLVFLLVFVATLFEVGEVLSEKWVEFKPRA